MGPDTELKSTAACLYAAAVLDLLPGSALDIQAARQLAGMPLGYYSPEKGA